MNDQIIRQQHILKCIPRYPRTINVLKLQDRLLDQGIDVHIRTIQRDLTTLSQVFIGIDNYKNQDNSLEWFWREDAPLLNLSGLTINQALSLVMVKKYLTPLFPEVTLNELDPYFEQAEATLEAVHGNSLYKWTKKIGVVQPTQPLLPPIIDPVIYKTVRDALLTDQQLLISYQRANGNLQDYYLNPLGLVLRNVVTYLIATKKDSNELRMFVVHRITKAEPLVEQATQPELFDLQSFINSGGMGFVITDEPLTQEIQLKAIFKKQAAKHLVETPLTSDQQLSDFDAERILVTATVQDNEQLFWWLLSFGDQIEVLEPLSIRARMINIANNLMSQYTDS
jgi:predicted DNA-binding transcriptional regulator YafY